VASLSPADKEGYLTKQGEHYKTWKKRWFVLKGKQLVYFEGQRDSEQKGVVDLDANSLIQDERERDRKKRLMFSVSTARRVFFIYADSVTDMMQWMEAIRYNIAKIAAASPPSQRSSAPTSRPPTTHITTASPAGPNAAPRACFAAAKSSVPYLQEEGSKMQEFWKIWLESVPTASELQPGTKSEYFVAISADVQKLNWRAAGPQTAYIQRMVDFFWNVGAPESEIDTLNEVGAAINPGKIGSWIDMSSRGGMDGGWFFPVEIPLKLATEASENCDAVKKLSAWAETNNCNVCISIGRDMGAAPPRQTEFRFRLPGSDFTNQLRIAMDAFFAFGFPAIPESALATIRSAECIGVGSIQVVVVTSTEGFVRLGVMLPNPAPSVIAAFCELAGTGAYTDNILRFQAALEARAPTFVEYQYLMKGFGYSVYKEGFDVMFHYVVGEEHGM
jgi:hypothetical protein